MHTNGISKVLHNPMEEHFTIQTGFVKFVLKILNMDKNNQIVL